MIARELVLQPVLLVGEHALVQIDEIERPAAELLHLLEQLQLAQHDLVLFAHPLDRHAHLEDLAVAAQHLLRRMDLHEVNVLRLLALQLQALVLQVRLERAPPVRVARMRIAGGVGEHKVDGALAVGETAPCLPPERHDEAKRGGGLFIWN